MKLDVLSRKARARVQLKDAPPQGDSLLCYLLILNFYCPQSYESRMGVSMDTEGEGEEDEEGVDSPGDASDDQRIIIRKEGRDSAPRRY